MVRLSGDLDVWSLDLVQKQIERSLSSAPDDEVFVVDLRGVSFMDSAAIGLLVHVHKTLQRQRRRLQLYVAAGSAPDRVLAITGLDTVLDVNRGASNTHA